MSRFYDRIGRFGFTKLALDLPPQMLEESEGIRRSLVSEAPIVVSADNVARYYEEHAHGFTFDLSKDVPNLAPPFPSFFVETQNPDILDARRRREGTAGPVAVESWGIYFEARDLKEELGADRWEEEAEGETLAAYRGGFAVGSARVRAGADDEMTRHAGSGIARPPRWHVASALFVERRGRRTVQGPLYANLAAIEQGGAVAKWNTGREVQLHRPYTPSTHNNAEDYFGAITEFAYPMYLAIAFMHCANVVRREVVAEAEKLSKKAKKRGKDPRPPGTRYYVLDIEPMKEVLRTEGRVGEEGLKRALHVTRGHFKHYTPERGGPFGREIQENTMVWTRQHVRGSKERGRVDKDYRVNPPDGRTSSSNDKSSGENGGDPSDEREVR